MEESDAEVFLGVAEAAVLQPIDQLGAKSHISRVDHAGVARLDHDHGPCQMPNDDQNKGKGEASGGKEVEQR